MLLTASSLLIQPSDVDASSHREAPFISKDAYADNTDVYAFISPENPDNIVLVSSWIPFEGPEGGPNYFEWDDNVLYDINIDNNGDAVPDVTYTLQSKTEVQNGNTFLYNVGPIGADGANWNRQQRYTISEVIITDTTKLVDNVLAPPVNIGGKSTANYDMLDDNFIYTVTDKGDEIKIFAGQTDDAFWVDLQVFDLLTLRGQQPPIGYDINNGQGANNIPVDSVAGYNNHSMVLEIPISRLTQGNDPVLGVWATSRRPSMRVLQGLAGLGGQENSGDPVQVSRLGMPLTNEAVLPYALKDAFNTLKPEEDVTIYTHPDFGPILQKSVEDPELGNLLCGLYNVPLPGDDDGDCQTEFITGTVRSGRGDIFDIFLQGMVLANEFMIHTKNGPALLPPGTNVNRPQGEVVPADMLRINTNLKGDICSPTPSRLGVLGGDACGFPNGRRLTDDVVEIELLAVAGAAYGVLDGRDDDFYFEGDLIPVLSDNVDFNDMPFQATFPYMATAQSGQEHFHQNAVEADKIIRSTMTLARDSADDAEQRKNGRVNLGSRDLELGELRGKPQTVGIRFPGVQIPKGATILTAHIEFTPEETSNGDATLTFHGLSTDNAEPFVSERYNITNRKQTGSSFVWENVPDWTKNQRHWSPNLGAIVQEIVNRDGWSDGNALAFVITGSGQRSAWSVNGKPGDAPMFYVEYAIDGETVQASGLLQENDVTNRNTVSSTVLRGTDRGEEILVNDDEEELNDEDVNAESGDTAVYLPFASQ